MANAAEATAWSAEAGLIGRSLEEARLVGLVDRLPASGGALVVVGDPGIGKTALLDLAARSAHRRDHRLLTVVGSVAERHLPYAALQRLVRPLDDHLSALPERQRAALRQACGGTAHEGTGPTAFVVGLALLELVEAAARARPLLLVVDDAHWLDASTIEVLGFLGRRLDTMATALVLASRQQSVPEPLLDLPALWLSPLGARESENLVRLVAPALASTVADQVLEQARGNPLALHELTRLAQTGRYPETGTPDRKSVV